MKSAAPRGPRSYNLGVASPEMAIEMVGLEEDAKAEGLAWAGPRTQAEDGELILSLRKHLLSTGTSLEAVLVLFGCCNPDQYLGKSW